MVHMKLEVVVRLLSRPEREMRPCLRTCWKIKACSVTEQTGGGQPLLFCT
jgi:hypothetical protein